MLEASLAVLVGASRALHDPVEGQELADDDLTHGGHLCNGSGNQVPPRILCLDSLRMATNVGAVWRPQSCHISITCQELSYGPASAAATIVG